jgi:hypothetical protein
MNANFTYGHALGTLGINQAYTLATLNDPWNYGVDYGHQYFDRKFVFNLAGSYQLPFGKGKPWLNSNSILNKIVGGWTLSPIFSFGTGLPLPIYTGSFTEYGADGTSNGFTAIPISGKASSVGNSPIFNVTSDGNIGVNGDQNNGGSGVNIFSNPTAAFNNYRPGLLGLDGRSGAAGILRGLTRWNIDLGLTKDTKITERFGFQLFAQAFNLANHMQWADPSNGCSGGTGLCLQDPASFGVSGGQYNPLTLGGSGASANYTRIIQVGLRIYF